MMKPLMWIILVLATAQGTMAQVNDTAFRKAFDRIATGFRGAVTAGYADGAGAPVVLVHGPRQRGGATPVPPGAAWHIGSITKTMTAVLLMRLAEQGVLEFDAPLSELLPGAELHPDWQALTLTQILSHTAGLPPNATRAQMQAAYGDDLTAARQAILSAHWGQPLPGKPGRYRYSNLGFILAGYIAEEQTGRPWQELILTEIAAPLGLRSVGFGAPDGPGDPRGTRGLLRPRPVAPEAPYSDNPAWLGPAGTVHMSLEDLLRWGQANMQACRGERPAFLSAQGCQRLHQPVSRTYGLGWENAALKLQGEDLSVQGHSGSNTLWITHLFYAPERDLVLALSMNEARMIRSQRDLVRLARALLSD